MKISSPAMLTLAILLITAACDDGITVKESCGDGFLDPGEECDGTEFIASDCIELGFYTQLGDLLCTANCTIDTSACRGRCGDGEVQGSFEDCDGTNLGGLSCQTLGYHGGFLSCGADCRHDLSSCENEGRCGDGVIQASEEACDGEALGGATCADQGFYEGDVTCTAECVLDYSECFGRCGDGVIQAGREECEEVDLGGMTCEDLGYYGGQLACVPLPGAGACTFDLTSCEEAGRCGDGVTDEGLEECDGLSLGGAICLDIGRYVGAPTCTASCVVDYSACEDYCGDGVLDHEFESCDGADMMADCAALGYYQGTPECSDDCSTVLTGTCTGRCGDGVSQLAFNEQCDGSDLSGQTCQDHTAALGRLQCSGNCEYDTIKCEQVFAIEAGYNHTCVIGGPSAAPERYFYCWGLGTSGQIGDFAMLSRPSPTKNNNLTGMQLISAGGAHSCGVHNGWGVCWGEGGQGQLGVGEEDEFASFNNPNSVAMNEPNLSAISAGLNHTCVIESTYNDVYCWGANSVGQLGRGTVFTRSGIPAPVQFSDNYIRVAAGEDHTCAVTFQNGLYCWGGNTHGQLGTGNTTNQSSPTSSSLSNVVRLAAGRHFTCGSNNLGNIYCWGRNDAGQIAQPLTTTHATTPQAVPGFSNTTGLCAGGAHACAITLTGTVMCWGGNDLGQLGNGTTVGSFTPVTVGGLPQIAEITCGEKHTCARNSNAIWCWGRNDHRQLGNLATTANYSATPVRVSP